MARPIRIPFVSDVRDFLKGTDNITDALDDVVDSLDDVAREAQDAGQKAGEGLSEGIEQNVEQVERFIQDKAQDIAKKFGEGLERGEPWDKLVTEARTATMDVAREAEQMADRVEGSAERMERSFRDAVDAIDGGGSGGSLGDKFRKAGDSADEGFNKAKEGVEEFKQSSQESAEEVASSFDGSAESIVDGFQEVASEAFAGFGPAGLVAGLAAAAGIGTVVGAFNRAKEESQEFKEKVGEIVGELNAIKYEGASAIEGLASRMREFVESAEEGATSLEDIKTLVEGVGQSENFDTFVQGIAGSPQALDEATSALRRFIESERENANNLANESKIDVRAVQAQELLKILEEEGKAQQEARDQEALLNEAGLDDIQRQIEAEGSKQEHLEELRQEDLQRQEEAAERAKEINQERADDVVGLTEAWQEHFAKITEDDKLTNEELNASLDQMIVDQTTKIANWNWAIANLSTEQMLVLEQFGEDRHQVIETLLNTPPDLRQATLDKMQAAGERLSQAQVDGYIKELPQEITGPTVTFQPDTAKIAQSIRKLQSTTVWVPTAPRPLGRQLS